ncbi:hypothetical protein PS870_04074 [Pseudomonas fluorescens]|uniref:Uncharacterized protein n=1 Tax=Pseudomonas fluorescens TaxID=294 RepID=A0A5E7MMR6_PSEFL|nr:hypothetical protein PS870_04074 [Pseudomonas fluorescens]
MLTFHFARTSYRKLQLLPELTHPAYLASRNSHHQSVGWHIPIDNRPCADKRKLPDDNAANNRTIRAQRSAFLHQCIPVLVFAFY